MSVKDLQQVLDLIDGTGLFEKYVEIKGYNGALEDIAFYGSLISKGKKDVAITLISKDIENYLHNNNNKDEIKERN